MEEPATDQTQSPAVGTAGWFSVRAVAGLLQKKESDTEPGEVGGKTGRESWVKDGNTFLDFLNDNPLGLFE